MNPDFFIVGCPRSGTTLLQRIVNAHPEIAVVPELFWITGRVRAKENLQLNNLVTQQDFEYFVQHKRFPELEMEAPDFQAKVGASFGELLEHIFAKYREKNHKSLVGNKTPQYVQNIPVLNAQWPSAKFIHIIRDGRDVALSMLNWKKADHSVGRYDLWNEDKLAATALYWKRKVLLGRQGSELLSALYYEIRYEALLSNPQQECSKLCEFLNVPYSGSMLNYYQFRPDTERAKNSRTWMPITPGLRDWKTQMNSQDIEKFEALVGDFLQELRYPRAYPHPSSESVNYADRMTSEFLEGLKEKGKFVPQAMSHDFTI
jgi:Sulfotransferase family